MQQSFDVIKKVVKLAFKLAVVIAVLVLAYNSYWKNLVVTSQPKENTTTGGTLTGNNSDHEVHSPSTNTARRASQDASCILTVVQRLEAEAPGSGWVNIGISSLSITKKWLNRDHCNYYFAVKNRPIQIGNSKLQDIYNVLNVFPNTYYDKYCSILESIFDGIDKYYFNPFGIANDLIIELETTSESFIETMWRSCRIDNTYWLKETVYIVTSHTG